MWKRKKDDLARLTKLSKYVCVWISERLMIIDHSGKIRMADQREAKATDSSTSKVEIQSEEYGTVVQERPTNLSAGVCKEMAYDNTEIHFQWLYPLSGYYCVIDE